MTLILNLAAFICFHKNFLNCCSSLWKLQKYHIWALVTWMLTLQFMIVVVLYLYLLSLFQYLLLLFLIYCKNCSSEIVSIFFILSFLNDFSNPFAPIYHCTLFMFLIIHSFNFNYCSDGDIRPIRQLWQVIDGFCTVWQVGPKNMSWRLTLFFSYDFDENLQLYL